MTPPPQTDAVESLLLELEADTARMSKVMIENVMPAGSPMFPLDFLAFAAAKHHASTTSAFVAMIRSWNMVVTSNHCNESTAWHVADPHKFASSVLKGERIDKMKTRAGQRLTDAHLVQLHKEQYPWLPAVYESLSGD